MRAALEAHLGTRQVSRVIYGAIIGLALMLSLQYGDPAAEVVAAALMASALAVALAEVYADYVGEETRTRMKVSRGQVREIIGDAVAVAFGIAFPACFFLLAAVGVFSEDTAFVLGRWTGVGLIAFYGFAAARLAGRGIVAAGIHAAAVGLIGVLLIVLKALIH